MLDLFSCSGEGGDGRFSGSGDMCGSCLIGERFRGDSWNLTLGDEELDLLQAILADLGLNVVDLSLQGVDGE